MEEIKRSFNRIWFGGILGSVLFLLIGILLLLLIFICLLIPYIFHYYYLENTVQYMYKQYDELKKIK